jgi:hypothetical protein
MFACVWVNTISRQSDVPAQVHVQGVDSRICGVRSQILCGSTGDSRSGMFIVDPWKVCFILKQPQKADS